MPAWTPFCRGHRRECSDGRCSAGRRRRRHWALRGPLRRERTTCRRSMPQVDRRDAARGYGMALAIVFRSVGLTCRPRGSADTRAEANATHGDQSSADQVQRASDPTGIDSGPERLRATQLPEAVPAGRGLRGQRGLRPADRERNTGISTRVTRRVTFRVTSVRIMVGTEGRSSLRCKGGTR
jgi:hypothetical protein